VTALLEHLDRQVASAQRMLRIVLEQGQAIKRQDSDGVLGTLADLQTELGGRARLELERDELLREAGRRLGRPAGELELEDVLALVPPAEAATARGRSAELRGLVAETSRLHAQNRVLIRQELVFLDHLIRVLSGTPQAGYSPRGYQSAPQAANVVNARA
jgi:hypothetical protein